MPNPLIKAVGSAIGSAVIGYLSGHMIYSVTERIAKYGKGGKHA